MGRDIAVSRIDHDILGFNPRARMGRDFAGLEAAARVSIHAPAWGATRRLDQRFDKVSIHAPAWGATVVLDVP